jgi:hypothetical protein
MLDRVDVHCVLTSEKVLSLLPNPLPEAPSGGVVVTDPGPGVFCDNAMDALILPLAPKPNVARKTAWFKNAMAALNKVGIVYGQFSSHCLLLPYLLFPAPPLPGSANSVYFPCSMFSFISFAHRSCDSIYNNVCTSKARLTYHAAEWETQECDPTTF